MFNVMPFIVDGVLGGYAAMGVPVKGMTAIWQEVDSGI